MRNVLSVVVVVSGALLWPALARAQLDDRVAGEILVDVRDDASPADLADLSRIAGAALRPNSALSEPIKLEVVDVAPADEAAALLRLAADPRVEHAEPMGLYRASFVPNDPLYRTKQWHLTRVGAERAWDAACGMGVTVAVIDTGVACFDDGVFSRGTDLSGTKCVAGYNFVDKGARPSDDQSHGTHVAGTIAQTTGNGKGGAGLAYCATLMPVKVLSKQGWGTTANIAEGVRFAADHGAQIINLSLGGPLRSAVLEDAVAHARSKGVTLVAAAGNSGGTVGYPAAYRGVIAVSATDSSDAVPRFSSRGPQIAIAAPGVDVTQQTVCNAGRDRCELFGTLSGTSMASPHVAAAAALLVGSGVTDPDAIAAALARSADARPDENLYGAGILRADSAVSSMLVRHLILRAALLLGLAALIARRIVRRSGKLRARKLAIFGALMGGFGLLPVLPFTGSLPALGAYRWAGELVGRPLAEWDLVVDADLHRTLVLATAAPAFVATMLLFGAVRARPLVGGLALGTAALAGQIALSGDVSCTVGPVGLRAAMVVSVALCAWIARLSLDERA